MQLTAIQRILGILLMLFSFTLIPPIGVALWYGEEALTSFIVVLASTFGAGLLIWLPVSKRRKEMRLRDGFVVVVMFWSVLSFTGALPFWLSPAPEVTFTDAVFESFSGLTTTGATVITGIDALPRSILYYRQQLQWLGGMGIIVLAVAVLPMLGIGGMQLYRAETPGPMKDSKLTPRITETAKALWYLYLGLTVVCILAYWAGGMKLFDAVGHAYSTVAIGVALCLGFSLPDNFRFPYAAIGFSDFWRRWHISLSTWLRDYLYIPLGGNRKGWHRTQTNLMVTMLLGGLWHGAAWTFVVWGGLHGLYLGIERFVRGRWGGAKIAKTPGFRFGLALLTYFLVNLTWVFFRAQDFGTAWNMTRAMLGFAPDGTELVLASSLVIRVVAVTIGILAVHWYMRNRRLEQVVAKSPWWLTGLAWAGMLFAIVITQGSGNAFIYFQF